MRTAVNFVGGLALALVSTLGATGCVIHDTPYNGYGAYHATTYGSARVSVGNPGYQYVSTLPPDPLYEEQTPSPGYGNVWIDGYWNWNGYDWVWIQGHWETNRQGYVYVEPYYDYVEGSGYVYTPGYWEESGRVDASIIIDNYGDDRPVVGHHRQGGGAVTVPATAGYGGGYSGGTYTTGGTYNGGYSSGGTYVPAGGSSGGYGGGTYTSGGSSGGGVVVVPSGGNGNNGNHGDGNNGNHYGEGNGNNGNHYGNGNGVGNGGVVVVPSGGNNGNGGGHVETPYHPSDRPNVRPVHGDGQEHPYHPSDTTNDHPVRVDPGYQPHTSYTPPPRPVVNGGGGGGVHVSPPSRGGGGGGGGRVVPHGHR